MSCGCNNNSSACPEVPYPQISTESVPSLIDNLVYALYGQINKSAHGGRVVWDIPCDPVTSPAEITNIPREDGEGLLCYIIRVFNDTFGNDAPFLRWSFIGNGSTATYSLTGANVLNKNAYLVTIDGVVQNQDNYTINNVSPITITFSSNIPNGSNFVVLQMQLKGDTGATGPIGPSGGATGATGIQGATGVMPPSNGGLFWTFSGTNTAGPFSLTGTTSNSSQTSAFYLAIVDGIVQSPTKYTISSSVPRTLTIVSPDVIPIGSSLVVVALSTA